jgi:hypothetical protein
MDVYDLDRVRTGCALIINNLHDEQKVTQNDVAKLKAMFKKIKVHVYPVKSNQDKNELIKIAEYLKVKDMKSYNIFFLVVLSHGLYGDKIVCSF